METAQRAGSVSRRRSPRRIYNSSPGCWDVSARNLGVAARARAFAEPAKPRSTAHLDAAIRDTALGGDPERFEWATSLPCPAFAKRGPVRTDSPPRNPPTEGCSSSPPNPR
eukprot:363645-Chlamydomonas_euryale.AAC.7